jgi:hypothetical protein
MALYSVFLGIGQLGGGLAGGSFAQAWSLDGLVYLNAILVAIAILAVLRLSVQERAFSPKLARLGFAA